jgi:hypothetical protein
VVLIDEQARPPGRLDVGDAPQPGAPLGLVIDGGVGGIGDQRVADRNHVRPRRGSAQVADPRGRDPLAHL